MLKEHNDKYYIEFLMRYTEKFKIQCSFAQKARDKVLNVFSDSCQKSCSEVMDEVSWG